MSNDIKNQIRLIEKTGRRYYKISRVKGGRNSSVYLAQEANGGLYCFKFYPKPSQQDKRKRLITEYSFLEYLEKCGLDNIPRVEEIDIEENWMMSTWLVGSAPKKIGRGEIQGVIEFLKSSNKVEMRDEKERLCMASEALISKISLINSIDDRINRLEALKSFSKAELETKEWLATIIKPLKNEIQNKLVGKDFQVKPRELIASQSDIGIHNMIKKGQEVFFIDFEYAGKDNIVKLVADLIYQPEHKMNNDLVSYLMEGLDKSIGGLIQREWKEQLKLAAPLICLKWSLIIVNNCKTEEDLERRLIKAKGYIKRHQKVFE